MAAAAVGVFPIGLGETGTPAGLQISAPPGGDGMVMSLLLAMEELIGPMPAPPSVAGCAGCTANVTNIVVRITGQTLLRYSSDREGYCDVANVQLADLFLPSILSTVFSYLLSCVSDRTVDD